MGRPIHKKYFGNTTTSGTGGYTITAITVTGAGTYQAQPTVVAPPTLPNGTTVTADVYTTVKNTSYVTVVAPGSGFQYNDVLTVSGGTLKPTGAAATFTIASTQLTVADIVSGGRGYKVNDTLTFTNAGGVNSVIQVDEVEATIPLAGVVIAGTGGEFTCTAVSQTLATGMMVTFTGSAPSGTGGQGSITGYNTGTNYYKISATNGSTTFTLKEVAGDVAVVSVAGGMGTATSTLNRGVITEVSVLTPGSRVTANPGAAGAASSTTSTLGTASTWTLGWGLLTFATNPTVRGGYKVIPTNPAGFTTGSGGTVTIKYEVTGTLVTNGTGTLKNRGYAENLNANVTFSNGVSGAGDRATVDAVTYALTTSGKPTILARAYTGGTRKDVDIVKQRSSRRYKVDPNDSTTAFVARLVAEVSGANADFNEMDITAFDTDSNEYWVTKLTTHQATLVRKSEGGQFSTGEQVKWNLTGAVLDESVMIEHN